MIDRAVMDLFPRMIGRLRRPDEGLRRGLRRTMSRAILAYGLLSFLLFILFVLASAAPHPLSLFFGDLALILPLLFRIVTLLFLVVLVFLVVLRAAVRLRLRNKAS